MTIHGGYCEHDHYLMNNRDNSDLSDSMSDTHHGYNTFTNEKEESISIDKIQKINGDVESGDGNGNGKKNGKTSNGDGLHYTNARKFDVRARNVLFVSTGLCILFVIGEVVGGVISGSLAIITDSSHLLTDLITYIISIIGLYTSSRPPTKRLTFGWYRVEIMGALVSVMLIWLVTGVLIYLATMRLINNNYEIEPVAMLITATCGVFFNVILITVLFAYNSRGGGNVEGKTDMAVIGHSHGTSHGHSHGGNVNVRSAFIHVLGDLTQSVGVLVAAFLIYFRPDWKIADPICTYIFGVFVFFTTVTFLRSIMSVLMEATPSNISHSEVVEFIKVYPNVVGVHDVHIWSLTTNRAILSAHIVTLNEGQTSETIESLNKALKHRFPLEESILQVEPVPHHADKEQCVCD